MTYQELPSSQQLRAEKPDKPSARCHPHSQQHRAEHSSDAPALPAQDTTGSSPAEAQEITIKWSLSASLYLKPGKSFGTSWLFSAKFDSRSQKCLFLACLVPVSVSSFCSPTSLPSRKEQSSRAQPLSDPEAVLGRAAGKQVVLAVLILELL